MPLDVRSSSGYAAMIRLLIFAYISSYHLNKSKKVEDIKADMDRLGLAYALIVVEQFRQYDQF